MGGGAPGLGPGVEKQDKAAQRTEIDRSAVGYDPVVTLEDKRSF